MGKWAWALLLAIGLICLTTLAINLAKDIPIWVWGQCATAEVVETWVEPINEDSTQERSFRYFVRYRFTTSSGQVITKTSTVGAQEWTGMGLGGSVDAVYQEQAHVPPRTISGLERGGSVAIVYFPLYPAHNRLDDSRFVPVLACAYLPLILLSWTGLVAGRRLTRASTMPHSEERWGVRGDSK